MRVLFDHQAFTMQQYGGVSRCFFELYKQLSKDNDIRISLRESDNYYLREYGYCHPAGYAYQYFISQKHFPGKARLFALINSMKFKQPFSSCRNIRYNAMEYGKFESIKALKKGDFDVFHPTFFDDYFIPYLNGKPFVLTIHDMIPELYPQYFDSENDMQILGKKKLAPLASAIIAVSEKTKEDVVKILNVPENKVYVVYHGGEHINSFWTSKQNSNENNPYILFVGERGNYKNFIPFTSAIAPMLKSMDKLQVVCTGRPFEVDELKQLSNLGVQNRFIYRRVLDDEEMLELYHHAKCLVYPSDYEGFGIPILEAYAADCPVLLNNKSCFPEIAGDAAVYFNFDNILEQISRVLSFTEKEREDLLLKQRTRFRLYSWEKSSKQIEKIYESVIGSHVN